MVIDETNRLEADGVVIKKITQLKQKLRATKDPIVAQQLFTELGVLNREHSEWEAERQELYFGETEILTEGENNG